MRQYNLTDDLTRSLQNARSEAHRLGSAYVGTEHLLLGVLNEPACVALLSAAQIDVERCRTDALEQSKRGRPDTPADQLPYTTTAKEAFEVAIREAARSDAPAVASQHLVLGLVADQRGIASRVLTARGATLAQLRALVGAAR